MRKREKRLVLLLLLLLLATGISIWFARRASAPLSVASQPWQEQWAVLPGLQVIAETARFRYPTSIAFVPEPGLGPDDPRYFVLELGGRLLAVTQSGDLLTVAENFAKRPEFQMAGLQDEYGAVGLCLAPEQGYIFVTYAHLISDSALENNLLRFQAQPHTFGIQATLDREVLVPHTAGALNPNHQIGACLVAENTLFLSIGDGQQPALASSPQSNLGKVLALTLDGEPAPGNPVSNQPAASPYVWASGFRNPFGFIRVHGRFFVADNGLELDRFLEIEPGQDYGWSGNDLSLGVAPGVILYPAVAPTQLTYVTSDNTSLPSEYGGSFIVGTFGNLLGNPSLARRHDPGLLQIPFDFESGQVSATPRFILRYQGQLPQGLVAVAAGPDGLYFAPFMPEEGEFSRLYRLTADPDGSYPAHLGAARAPEQILSQEGCFGCHSLGGRGQSIGPSLDARALRTRLMERLNSPEYLESLEALDLLETPPLPEYRAQRALLREAEPEARLRLWLQYRLEQPRFDDPHAVMPDPDLSAEQIASLVEYLLTPPSITTELKQAVIRAIPVVEHRMLFYSFFAGSFGGIALSWAVWFIRREWTKRGSRR